MEEYVYAAHYAIEQKHWWFAARQRILWRFVHEKLMLPRGARLLDVGCGTGAILKLFSHEFDVYGQDVSPEAIWYCKQRGLANLFLGTLSQLPETYYGRFDLVTALDVIEHIDDDLSTLELMKELIRPQGRVLITVPAYPWLWSIHDVVMHHRRRYTKRTLSECMKKAGFTVEYISHYNFIFFPLAVLRRLVARMRQDDHATDLRVPQPVINSLLRQIFSVEGYILPFLKLPFGLSLIAVGRKDPSGFAEKSL